MVTQRCKRMPRIKLDSGDGFHRRLFEAGVLAFLEHPHRRLTLRFSFRLAHLHDHRDGPDVAERILKLPVSLAPELVVERQSGFLARVSLLPLRRALAFRANKAPPPQYRCGQDKTDAPMPRAFHSPSQRPMKTSSSYASRMRTRRRRIPSSRKPRDSYRRRARVFDANTHSSAFLKPRTRIHSRMRFIRNLPRPTSRHPSRIAMPTPPTCCVFGKFPPSQSAEPTISPAASATNRTL